MRDPTGRGGHGVHRTPTRDAAPHHRDGRPGSQQPQHPALALAGAPRAGLELHEDRTRRLPAADPFGRNVVISCGAALHHLQVAAGALGWETEVHRVPGQTEVDPARARRAAPRPAVRARGGRSEGHRRALHRSPSVHVLAGARGAAPRASPTSRQRTEPRPSRSSQSPSGSGPSCSWAGPSNASPPTRASRASSRRGWTAATSTAFLRPCSPGRPRPCAEAIANASPPVSWRTRSG